MVPSDFCLIENTYTVFPQIIAVPRLIAPPLKQINEGIAHHHPSHHLLFLLSPPCLVEVASDPAKLITDNSRGPPRVNSDKRHFPKSNDST